jgi:hypothetical protein
MEDRVNEAAGPFIHFTYRERHIQCLWADTRNRPDQLKTVEGEPVEVEHPGDWNLEAGPDFLNAVLRIGRERRRVSGDLEIHIHPGGWNQHGHAGDPRFANVQFHVVWFPGPDIPGLLQIPMNDIMTSDPAFSFENIDITAFPYSIPDGDFPLKGIDPDRKTEFLEAAGEERLRLKAERFSQTLSGKDPHQLLWEELLAALGYKNNKSAFRQLAILLPLERICAIASSANEAYAVLLGLSGLLPANPSPKWPPETRAWFRILWDFWWKQNEDLKESAMNRSAWNLAGIRPANHPVRRLMAAAYYAFRIPDIVNNTDLLTGFPDRSGAETPTLRGNFWTTHISWKTPCDPTALVGQSRANAILTNILIPYKAATGSAGLDLSKLPVEPSNSIIRQTAYTLFGPDHTHKVYKSALARQGLIQIFHDYVITHRLSELKERFQPNACLHE